MNAKKLLQTDILDIIFDQRNKAYGAYELRRNYHTRAKKAVALSMVIALLAISAPLIAGLMKANPDITLHGPKDPTVFTNIPVPPPPPPKPQPVVPAGPKVTPTRTPPIIVKAMNDPLPVIPDPILPPTPPGPSGPQGPGDPVAVFDPTGPVGPHTTVIDPVVPEITYNEMNVEQQPEFPGGEDALMVYLSSHIQYPARAIDKEIGGRVVLGFVVNKNGDIDELKVLKGLGYGCDEEAMRVVGGMPKWKPGKNNGKAVNVYFNLPIVFEMK